MKAKTCMLISVIMLVAAFAFAGGGGESGEMEGAAEPMYGGTLTHLHSFTAAETPDWDPHKAAGPAVITGELQTITVGRQIP